MSEGFTSTRLEEEREKDNAVIFSLRLSDNDIIWFQPAKEFIKQPKNSTAIKQLAEIGATVVIHDKKIAKIIEVIGGNFRRNRRIGIAESEYDVRKL